MLHKLEKIDKNTHPPKGTRSGKQMFFPYPSVFAESYVRCDLETDISVLQARIRKNCSNLNNDLSMNRLRDNPSVIDAMR